ncbi:DUF881 domain-containing protein [Calorimonas adulescens]|uniref:DUF881 domain-containing protein n=1 Tax=Calorimonas adulescens TaxID=2606906 RepID=A0A5D8QD44_9THEO|nr:DUF881 domain-containing protein [Calorimonas adulescens]TZE82044.1 DUF881 domain-containing protein [Calorimonas adulescens]
MISLQFRSVQNGGGAVTIQRVEELTAQLKQVEDENNSLKLQVSQLQNKLDEYETSSSQTNTIISSLREQLEDVNILAGLTDVQGPGVIVTLNDSKQEIQPGEDPSLFLIHDDDLLKVLNELRAAGAEAVSLNEQRIVATTEIRCVGPTVNVNSVRFAPPYVFKAIGDPDTLEAALMLKGGVVDTLRYWGIEISIKKADKIIVPRYNGTLNFKYAAPVKEGAK